MYVYALRTCACAQHPQCNEPIRWDSLPCEQGLIAPRHTPHLLVPDGIREEPREDAAHDLIALHAEGNIVRHLDTLVFITGPHAPPT